MKIFVVDKTRNRWDKHYFQSIYKCHFNVCTYVKIISYNYE